MKQSTMNAYAEVDMILNLMDIIFFIFNLILFKLKFYIIVGG